MFLKYFFFFFCALIAISKSDVRRSDSNHTSTTVKPNSGNNLGTTKPTETYNSTPVDSGNATEDPPPDKIRYVEIKQMKLNLFEA